MLDPFHLVVDDAGRLERLLPCGAQLVINDHWRLAIAEGCGFVHPGEGDLDGADLGPAPPGVAGPPRLAPPWACPQSRARRARATAGRRCGSPPPSAARGGRGRGAIRSAGVRLGVSTHDQAELERTLAVRPVYVALGPIYPTTLKRMPGAPQGPDRVKAWKLRIAGLPLVAIGGLTPEHTRAELAVGADRAAVATGILPHPQPEARARARVAATRRAA